MQFIVIPSGDIVQRFYQSLFQLEEADYDIEDILGTVINIAVRHDTDGCVDYQTMTLFDNVGFQSQSDREIYRSACLELTMCISELFHQCRLYRHGYHPYYFVRLLGWDIVITPEKFQV